MIPYDDDGNQKRRTLLECASFLTVYMANHPNIPEDAARAWWDIYHGEGTRRERRRLKDRLTRPDV